MPFIVEAFEIMNGTQPQSNDSDNIYTDGWDVKTKQDASSYLINATQQYTGWKSVGIL